MTYEKALEFIYGTDWKGSVLGLERMTELMHRLGDPQKKVRFVHVAGTNGKGSASTFISFILNAAGYKTGLYTSPHLVKINERMRIRGIDISDEDFIAAAEAVYQAAQGMNDAPTEFEIITAMAFWYYARENCDFVVLEVGLGGRLDATNIIDAPEVAVLMNIGLEHTEILGDTLEKIAAEKAGIIKDGCDVVAYRGTKGVEHVFASAAAAHNAPIHFARFSDIRPLKQSLSGQSYDWREFRELRIRLLGEHQLCNATVAVETALTLRGRGFHVTDDAIRAGLADACWEARFEVLSEDPVFIIDGAHNPQCVEALAASIREYLPGRRIHFLMGVLADKDYEWMLDRLCPLAASFVCLTPQSSRALAAGRLAEIIHGRGLPAVACDTPEEGIAAVLREAKGEPAVACGSLYMMGGIRSAFPKERELYLSER